MTFPSTKRILSVENKKWWIAFMCDVDFSKFADNYNAKDE